MAHRENKLRIGVILEVLPGDIDQDVRLAKALKNLWRAYRIRNAQFVTPEELQTGRWVRVKPVEGADQKPGTPAA